MRGSFILVVLHLAIIPYLTPALLSAQSDLDYQNRGEYYEGIRPKPVSGYDIEVLSVLVDYRDPAERLPDQLRARFYLDSKTDVYLNIREQDYRLFYWLDKVKRSIDWRAQSYNEFVWPTENVLRRLDPKLDIYELGVLIRLGQQTPAQTERLAPVILYHSHLPESVLGYLFTMKANGDARLSCSIYQIGKDVPLMTQAFRRIPGGRPFTVRWGAEGAEEANYSLACKGFFLDTNQPLRQDIRFHHTSKVK
jgi:hypothetical protein